MPRRSLLPEAVETYVSETMSPESSIQERLRAETEALPQAGMQIGPDQGRLLSMLVRWGNVKWAIEIGTFTGYSALCIATALPEDGKLICCDVSDEWTSIGRKYWHEAGVDGKIDLRIMDALTTLQSLIHANMAGTFDFVFIDADKPNTANYVDRALQLLRPGGLIAIDNVLWSGKVADSENQEESTVLLRSVSESLRDDERVETAFLTVGDGLLLARKR